MTAPLAQSGLPAGCTPGPWECVPGARYHGPYVSSAIGDVADCYEMVENGAYDSKPAPFQGPAAGPNARLIAAAPEMYAALKQIEGEMGAGLGSSYGETREQVRRALAKAEGRP